MSDPYSVVFDFGARKERPSGQVASPTDGDPNLITLIQSGVPTRPAFRLKFDGDAACALFPEPELTAAEQSELSTAYSDWTPTDPPEN